MLLRIAKFHLKRKREKKRAFEDTCTHSPEKMKLNSAAAGAERGVLLSLNHRLFANLHFYCFGICLLLYKTDFTIETHTCISPVRW